MRSLLESFIRIQLNEGVLDKEATQIVRRIMPWIKKKLLNDPEISEYDEGTYKSVGTMFDELDVNDRSITLEVGLKLDRNDKKEIVVSGGTRIAKPNVGKYDFDGRYGVNVYIIIPASLWSVKSLQTIREKVTSTVRHELEHVFDKTLKYGQHDDDMSAKEYIMQPHEIRGWVSGMYKQAKTSRTNFKELARKKLDDYAKNCGLNDTTDIWNAWMEYASKRFPGAQ